METKHCCLCGKAGHSANKCPWQGYIPPGIVQLAVNAIHTNLMTIELSDCPDKRMLALQGIKETLETLENLAS